MGLLAFIVVLSLGWPLSPLAQCPGVTVSMPAVALTGVPTSIPVALRWGLQCFRPPPANWSDVVLSGEVAEAETGAVLYRADQPVFGDSSAQNAISAFTVSGLTFTEAGQHSLLLRFTLAANATDRPPPQSVTQRGLWVLPLGLALLPPALCLLLAGLLQQPLLAMALALWAADTLIHVEPIHALHHAIAGHVAGSIQDSTHAKVLVFVTLMAGLIGVMGRSGGLHGLANAAVHFATDSRRLQLVMWVLGVTVFFSDYASCLLVGTTMRLIADRLHVSREKCAFIVDSTASPISSLAPVSSYAAYETALIAASLRQIGSNREPYMLFLQTIPYRFYPILMIALGLLISLLQRDFHVMSLFELHARSPDWRPGSPDLRRLRALHPAPTSALSRWSWWRRCSLWKRRGETEEGEALGAVHPQAGQDPPACHQLFLSSKMWRRLRGDVAGSGGSGGVASAAGPDVGAAQPSQVGLQPKPSVPHRWFNAAIPIFLLLSVSFGGLVLQGRDALTSKRIVAQEQGRDLGPDLQYTFVNTINASSPLVVLLTAAAVANLVCVGLVLGQRLLTLREVVAAWVQGAETLLGAMCVLILAWAFGQALQDLHTPDALVHLVGQGLPPGLLPALVFLAAAFVSFCTGTSWGTMAVMFPLAVPLAHRLAPGDEHLLTVTISSILTGSVFGDHCSPFSDSTILSAMACGCDLLTHVRTQLPYAVAVAAVGLLCGDLLVGFAVMPLPLVYPVAVAVLAALLWAFGHPIPLYTVAHATPAAPGDNFDEEEATG